MNKKQKRLSDYEISSGTLGVTEMFGAILFMLLGGLKKRFQLLPSSRVSEKKY